MPIKIAITGPTSKGTNQTILLEQKQARELQKELHDLLGPYVPNDAIAKSIITEKSKPEPTIVPMEEPKPGSIEDIFRDWEKRKKEAPWHERFPWPTVSPPTWVPATPAPYKLPDVWCGLNPVDPKRTAAATVDWSKVNGVKFDISTNPADNKGTTFP